VPRRRTVGRPRPTQPPILSADPLAFPHPDTADASGLVAMGGDLSPERLVAAYARGIFPWPHEGYPLLWFSPDPRMVLPLEDLHVPRRLARTMRSGRFEVRLDTAFDAVIARCAVIPRGLDAGGTWITPEMQAAYGRLHALGYAHSAEAWRDGVLVGGLYGVSLGAMFCGESMFALEPDASKAAFVGLATALRRWGFHFVDAQTYSTHMDAFGATMWPRGRYLEALEAAMAVPTRVGRWEVGAA